MVPAPKVSHFPDVFAAVRQDEVRATTATSLELALITSALFVSSVLSLTPKRRLQRQPRNPVYSNFVIAIAICFTLGAFSVAIATLTLGWLRVISLDAVAGIVFALGPAFFSIPREILSYSRDSARSRLMWNHISLNIPTTHFQYVRLMPAKDTQEEQFCFEEHSKPDSAAERAQTTGDKWPRQFDCDNLMYIRHMLHSSRHSACYSLFSKFWNYLKYTEPSSRAEFESCLHKSLTEDERMNVMKREQLLKTVRGNHVYGIPIKSFPNLASVQDMDDGKTSWWWSGVSSARHLIARPLRAHLESGRRVGNALALLSDIISIGDLVLHFHLDIFEWMLQMDHDVRAAVTSAPGLTCTRFIRELELDGWDAIGHEDLLPVTSTERSECTEYSDKAEKSDGVGKLSKTKRTSFSISPSKHYPLLFLILAEKSRRFLFPTADNEGKMPSGQYVLDELWGAKEQSMDEFHDVAKQVVKKWLQGWGLKLDFVQEEAARFWDTDEFQSKRPAIEKTRNRILFPDITQLRNEVGLRQRQN